MPMHVSPTLEELRQVATKADFGQSLSRLKDAADMAIRDVERRIRASGLDAVPLATLGDYFAGRHLPSAVALRKILTACGVTDQAVLAAWDDARLRARRSPGRPATGQPAPYRGLACFRREDADWFFGRSELTALAVGRARECQAAGLPLVVVGPSGAGKSSLLRAGLIPALARRDDPVPLAVPGTDPLGTLAGLIDGTHRIVVVDQFEEIFAPAVDEASRKSFIGSLFAAAARDREPPLVLLGLRADFYGQALRYPPLARALQDGQVVAGPMSATELREAIVEPARLAKTSVDDALVELLLSELRLQGHAAHDAGALPLLSYALLAAWDRHRSGRLTVADYLATGGIAGAVRNAADRALGELDNESRPAARWLFSRLVWVGQDTPDIRRRAAIDELCAGPDGHAREALDTFIAHRLLTADDGTVEIAHEIVLSAWPVLRGWIDGDRADLLIRRRVTEAAQEWSARGRDSGDLLRGGKLAMARSLATDPGRRAELTSAERELLDASLAAEHAQRQAERRGARRLRNLAAGLAVAVLLAGGLTAYAFGQRAQAASQRELATSRQIASEAAQLRGQDPGLAAQLSLAAFQAAPTPQARGALLDSSATAIPTRLTGPSGIVQAVTLSPDRRLLAAVDSDGGLWLWNLADPDQAHLAARLGTACYAAAFSPDGHTLAVGCTDDNVHLFSVTGQASVRATGTMTGPGSTVYSVAFSPDGQTLAAGSADGNVWLWNLADPRGHGQALAADGGYVQAVAFDPAGGWLAAGTAAGTVRLWNLSTLGRPAPSRPAPGKPARGKPTPGKPTPGQPTLVRQALTGPAGPVYSVAFSPDGQTLAAGSGDSHVYLWSIRDRRSLGRLSGATSWVNAVAFSPSGDTLAAGGSDDTVRLWDVATRKVTATLAHPGPVTSVAWDGAGRLVTGAADGDVRLWRLPPPVLAADGVVNGVAFSKHGGLLAVASDDLRLWNAATRLPLGPAQTVSGAVPEAVAFAPDRQLLATADSDGTVRLWGYTRSGALTAVGGVLRGAASGQAEAVAFSPTGGLLASGGDDGTVRLWSVGSTARTMPVTVLKAFSAQVFTVAFSPGGQVLAAAGANDTVRLWNLADPAHPAPLATLTGPAGTVYSVAFSPSGDLLAAASADRSVYLWNVSDPRHPVRDGPALTGPASYVYALAFSPSGGLLAAGSTDDTVWLWTMARTPALYATLTGPTNYVYAVAFSPSGGTLAAGSADGTVRLWDTGPGDAAAGICAAAGDQITRQEWERYVPGVPYAAPCVPGEPYATADEQKWAGAPQHAKGHHANASPGSVSLRPVNTVPSAASCS